MKPGRDDEHFIPVIDCPCGEKDIPLSTKGPLVKEGYPDIYIWYCPACDRVPVDDSEIKGYVSLAELKAMGWEEPGDEA